MLTELQNFAELAAGDRFGVIFTVILLLVLLGYMIWRFPKQKASGESRYRAIMGEFVGTLLLALAVFSDGFGTVAGSFAAGLTVMVLVYLFASVSSAHFNPAVTVAAFLARYVSARRAIVYIVTQCLAAFTAVWLLEMVNGYSLTRTPNPATGAVVLAEFFGAAVLIGVVATAVIRKESLGLIAALFGVTVMVAPVITGTPAFINPALALSVSGGWATIIMPILGGIIGVLVAYSLTIDRNLFKIR